MKCDAHLVQSQEMGSQAVHFPEGCEEMVFSASHVSELRIQYLMTQGDGVASKTVLVVQKLASYVR